MATSIEWTDETWNPVAGCEKISPGCMHCYASTMAGRIVRMGGPAADRYRLTVIHRDANGKRCAPDAPGAEPRGDWNGSFVEVPEALSIPLQRRKPTMFFVNSMSDLFGEGVSDEYIAAVFGVMAATPQHTFQVLTKRADRMARWFEAWMQEARALAKPGRERNWITEECVIAAETAICRARGVEPTEVLPLDVNDRMPWHLQNVWVGVSVEDRKHGLPRLDDLRKVPAAVRMVSFEPLLEDLGEINLDGIGWAIVGGESGPGARPMHPDWPASIAAQCKAAGVPYFWKQQGAWLPFYDRDRDDPDWRNVPAERDGVKRLNLAGGEGFHGERLVYFRRTNEKNGDVAELARVYPDLAAAGTFRREWPEVSHG